ncbi:hypothetical protein JCM19236_3507 [Vibrio sp. JCM 19236]|nr:hypothetical protein JCM19236_3507 [Vibrio sp. JCM 19236]
MAKAQQGECDIVVKPKTMLQKVVVQAQARAKPISQSLPSS